MLQKSNITPGDGKLVNLKDVEAAIKNATKKDPVTRCTTYQNHEMLHEIVLCYRKDLQDLEDCRPQLRKCNNLKVEYVRGRKWL